MMLLGACGMQNSEPENLPPVQIPSEIPEMPEINTTESQDVVLEPSEIPLENAENETSFSEDDFEVINEMPEVIETESPAVAPPVPDRVF